MGISIRVQDVFLSIENACKRCNRTVEEVKLIAVSKNFPVEIVREAYDSGIRVFGENRAQELRDKAPKMPGDIEWHFIGHLQKNKIKYVVPVSTLIQSVDSLSLAETLSEFGKKNNKIVSILVEVNTSGEASKFGLNPDKVISTFMEIRQLQNIKPEGLMTIGPLTSNENKIRESFRLLKTLQKKLSGEIHQSEIATLSMGMSQDYEIAIEEGSTMIRVGTAIFGRRLGVE